MTMHCAANLRTSNKNLKSEEGFFGSVGIIQKGNFYKGCSAASSQLQQRTLQIDIILM